MVDIKILEDELIKNNLTSYLKNVSNIELQRYKDMIICDDIIGIREKIYTLINLEMESRKLYNNITIETDADILNVLKFYPYSANEIDLEDMQNSINFYKRINIDYKSAILYFPGAISIKNCYKIYANMKKINLSDEYITNILSLNLDSLIEFNKSIQDSTGDSKNYLDDKAFNLYIYNTFGNVQTMEKEKINIKQI